MGAMVPRHNPWAKGGPGGHKWVWGTLWGAGHPQVAPTACHKHPPQPCTFLVNFKVGALVHGGAVPPTCPPLNALGCHKLGGPNPKPHAMATMHLGPPGALALGGVHAPPTQWAAIKCASGWCGQAKAHAPTAPHQVAHTSPWVVCGALGNMVWPTQWLHHLHHLAPTHTHQGLQGPWCPPPTTHGCHRCMPPLCPSLAPIAMGGGGRVYHVDWALIWAMARCCSTLHHF